MMAWFLIPSTRVIMVSTLRRSLFVFRPGMRTSRGVSFRAAFISRGVMPMETAAMAYTLVVTSAGMGVISCMKGMSTRENSPTLVSAVEAMMPMRPGIFRKLAATMQATNLIARTKAAKVATWPMCSHRSSMSISSPAETKKMVRKRSLKGSTSLRTRWL